MVVLVQEQEQAPPVHFGTLAEGQALANKTTQPLAQGVVEAFDMVGLPAVFANSVMMSLRHNLSISLPEVRVGSLVAVTRRNALPKTTAGWLVPCA